MGLKCALFGHEWGEWHVNPKVNEKQKTHPIWRSGHKVAIEVKVVKEEIRECTRCGNNETKERKIDSWKEGPDYDLSEENLPPSEIKPINIRSTKEKPNFIDRLKKSVRREKREEIDDKWQSYLENGSNFVANNDTDLGRFKVQERYYKGSKYIVKSEFINTESEDPGQFPDLRENFDLYEDDFCIVDVQDTNGLFPVLAEVKKVRRNRLDFRPAWNYSDVSQNDLEAFFDNNADTEIFIHKIFNPTPYDRRIESLDKVENSVKKRKVVNGTYTPKFIRKIPAPDPKIELNTYQQKALVWSDVAEDLVLIHGPPGTGKTRTLTAYIRHAVERNQSVLLTAHSNQAVDNLIAGDSTTERAEPGTLHAMAQNTDGFKISRVGKSFNKMKDVVLENYEEIDWKYSDIVAATTNASHQFDVNEFDVAVVDEATQASIPATAIPLVAAEKIILAGDHKQLPPFERNSNPEDGEDKQSLFEYFLDIYGDSISVFLQKQYRMNELIAKFPSENFYGGRLETAERNRNWTIDGLNALLAININGKERSDGHSYNNPDEAMAAAKQVDILLRKDVMPAEIGVISAYKGQKSLIEAKIRQLDHDGIRKITVDTVDSFQGGEREAIIVSFVRSNKNQNSGFLEDPDKGPRRLNVAITRAKKRLVLIGDWETLGTESKINSCAKLYQKLAMKIRQDGEMIGDEP